MSAIYPTVSQEPTILRRASAVNVLVEPADTSIDAAGYTQSVGFGGTPCLVRVKLVAGADSDDDVTIEICDEPTFTVPSVHPDSPKAIDSLLTANILQFTLPASVGYWRIKNTTSIAIEVSYWRLPNRI